MRFEQLPIVFLQGAGRSGSDLLRTLLDNHDEIVVLPFNDKFNTIWIKNELNDESSVDEVVEKVLYSSKIVNFKQDFFINMGARQDYSMINWNAYEKFFRQFLSKNNVCSRNARIAIYYAFAKILKKDFQKLKIIIADGFYSDYTSFITKDFPDARFIHILKDHRSNIYSLKEYYRRSLGTMYPLSGTIRNVFFLILEDYMITNMKMLHRNKETFKERLKIVKHEDILAAPEKTISSLCRWLDVEFNKNLLETTRIGKPSLSSSAFNETGITGINPEFANRWKTQMPSTEIRMIEFLFKNSMNDLGYKSMYPNSALNKIYGLFACFLPWRGELLPHKEALKQSRFGSKGLSAWVLIKYFVYIANNLFMYLINRGRLLYQLVLNRHKF